MADTIEGVLLSGADPYILAGTNIGVTINHAYSGSYGDGISFLKGINRNYYRADSEIGEDALDIAFSKQIIIKKIKWQSALTDCQQIIQVFDSSNNMTEFNCTPNKSDEVVLTIDKKVKRLVWTGTYPVGAYIFRGFDIELLPPVYHLIKNESNDLFSVGGGLNKLGKPLINAQLFTDNGFNDIALLNESTFNQSETMSDMGVLGSGQMFSVDIDASMIKNVNVS